MSEAQRNELGRDLLPLRGRVALVTGVSRRGGIGYAIACRLAAYGASVFAHHFVDHDREQEWGADDLDTVLDGFAREWSAVLPGHRFDHRPRWK